MPVLRQHAPVNGVALNGTAFGANEIGILWRHEGGGADRRQLRRGGR